MHRIQLGIALLGILLAAGASRAADPMPVLVELFTSEGCDSCPPADAVLLRLAQLREIAGAEIIVMSEHVDYWDYLGWKDPYSARQFTDRQNEYARALGGSNVYTPQMIIDGRYDVLGSSVRDVQETISRAARTAKSPVRIEAHGKAQVLDVHVDGDTGRETANYYLAITEDNLSDKVTRGENKGLTLSHAAVVRKLISLGRSKPNQPFTTTTSVPLAAEWKLANLRAIAFAQNAKSGAILSVSSTNPM
jgi:hypothetical protein